MRINPFVFSHVLCIVYFVLFFLALLFCSTKYYEKTIPVDAFLIVDTLDSTRNKIKVSINKYSDYLKLTKYAHVVVTISDSNSVFRKIHFRLDTTFDRKYDNGLYLARLKQVGERTEAKFIKQNARKLNFSVRKEKTLLLKKILGIKETPE